MKWKDNGVGDYEQPPVGTFVARCVKIIDIGTQKGEYQGKVTIRRQCIIGWELPTELMQEGDKRGKPFYVSKFYTSSLSEKATLRQDLKNWRGRDFTAQELSGFEAKNILGKACMLSLTENENGKVRVTGVMACPNKTHVPEQVNASLYFSLEPDEFNEEIFESLSEGYKKLIQASPEYETRMKDDEPSPFEDFKDDIPF